ncbi:MAG: cupin domain-containing protein [Acidimicrobiales bacterium]
MFVRDEVVESDRFDLLPGWEFYDIWAGDRIPAFPDRGDMATSTSYFPPVGGFRFSFSVVPPMDTPAAEGLDLDVALAEVDAVMPGMMALIEPDGMHTTDTIDFEVIVRGQVLLELTDGTSKLLGPGDTVVQNGTRHVWRNPGPESCLMAVFMTGAVRRPTP